MTVEKTIRLSKAIKDLNTGIDHIYEFLEKNKIEFDRSPNTKISMDIYDLLVKEFNADLLAKKEANEVTQQKMKRDVVVTVADLKREEEEAKIQEKESDEDLQNDLVKIKAEAAESQKKTRKTKSETAKTTKAKSNKTDETEEEILETEEQNETEVKTEPEVVKASGRKKAGLKIVDKIDLSKGKKTKSKSKKSEEESAEETVSQEDEVSAESITEAPVAIVDESKAGDKTDEVKQEPKAEEDSSSELFSVKVKSLTGLTVKGKIEIPKEPEKKSAKKDKKDKKDGKRTRLNKQKVATADTKGNFHQRNTSDTGNRFNKNKRVVTPKEEVSDEEIKAQIKETLARLNSSGGKSQSSKARRRKREQAAEQQKSVEQASLQDKTIKVTEFVTVNDLSKLMNVPVKDIISACFSLGHMVSINQRLDAELLSIIADEFGFKVDFVSADVQESILTEEDDPDSMTDRAPIVTVMGHVDHGKTSLLDYVRKSNVIADEAGGITQHIGSYEVSLEDGRKITFLDTPGHEAFTAMRARGAKLTDVAIIVIAADDSVMPQTKEAINHAQAAQVPIVFAINKIDKDGANPEKIKEQLASMNFLVEDWGGKFQCQEISAKKGLNIDKLLEKVLIEAEMLELKANADKNAVGTVIESSLDKGRGYVTNILVQSGSLEIGDVMVAGCYSGRVKAMFNERGQRIDAAGPSQPVVILGLSGAPQAGDMFNVLDDEREAREIANKRLQLQREQGIRTHKHITLDEIGRRLAIGDFKELNVIVKGDVDGSVEALADSLIKLSTREIQINVILKAVGQITESDVLLASASDAIIIGFQVRPSAGARKLAETEQIDIRLYSIIYNAIEELKSAMEGMLSPEIQEKIVCNIEIRETFKIPKVGTIAGCYVLEGKVHRNTKVRLIRDGIVVYSGELASLKRFKDDVKEVVAGMDCGLNIANFNDVKVGDIIEGFEEIAVKRTLVQ
ncbi:MAG TPA: translation initiation factor IF-2 [Bacteroidia bacterium]|nr:translation initiation factor IF-2 [Bacteroidia bacterium]HNT79321.1 translation initiation factor IF-2 [Bacteroidia bacterium]